MNKMNNEDTISSMDKFMFGPNYKYQNLRSNSQNRSNYIQDSEEDSLINLINDIDLDRVFYYAQSVNRIYNGFKPLYEQIVPIISKIKK